MSLTFESFIREQIVEPGLSINESAEALNSTALLIREAERRGWTVDRYARGMVRFLEGNTVVGGLNQAVPSTVSSLAVISSNIKHATKQAFENSGLPVAPGKFFRVNEHDHARKYFETAQKPLVIKSSAGSMGDSVSVNVYTLDDFEMAWNKASRGLRPKSVIILEQQFEGIDIRAFVVDGKMVGAVTRVPAFVVGDGRSTLGDLVKRLTSERRASAYLRTLPVRIDHEWIAKQELTDESVLEIGRVLTLNRTANTHQGAANFGITRLISTDIRILAEQAARSIPGLNAVGVDLMIKTLDNADQAILLETNASGSLLLHHYPAYGESVDVARKIIDSISIQHNLSICKG